MGFGSEFAEAVHVPMGYRPANKTENLLHGRGGKFYEPCVFTEYGGIEQHQ